MILIIEEHMYTWGIYNGGKKLESNMQKNVSLVGEITSSFYGLIYSFLYFPISS